MNLFRKTFIKPFAYSRISGTEWLEESLPNEPSWRSEDTARLAPLLYEHGVDLLDVSSGGNHPQQKIRGGPAYQSPFAKDVMHTIGAMSPYQSSLDASSASVRPSRLIVATVGAITSGTQANQLLEDGSADVVIVGRQFLKNPGMVWAWAEELGGIQIRLASQIGWAFKGRGKKTRDGREDSKNDNRHGGAKV